MRYFMKPALLWFAGTYRGDIRAYKILHGASITVVGRHHCGLGPVHKIFHGTSITVVCCHGYGLRQERIRSFTEPQLPWLAGTVMGEIGAYKTFHVASITVVG